MLSSANAAVLRGVVPACHLQSCQPALVYGLFGPNSALALMLGWRGARHAGVPDPDRHRDCEAEHQARLRIRLLELMSDWAYGMRPRTW